MQILLNINISGPNSLNFNSDSFFKYLSSLKLENTLKVVEYVSEEIIVFQIEQTDNSIIFSCAKLKIHKEYPIDSSLDFIYSAILKFSGFQKTLLKGLSVRDSSGTKFKPEIEIFTFQYLTFCLPSEILFSRENIEISSEYKDLEVFSNSEILSTVLFDTPLIFKNEEKIFKFYKNQGKIYLKYLESKPCVCLDYLVDYSVKKSLSNYLSIANKYPVFQYFLENRIENIVFNKKTYQKLCSDVLEMNNLVDFLENTPRFQDERDDIVKSLQNMVVEQYPPENIHKYQYLEVFKCRQIKNNNKLSLKKFANP